MVNSSIFIVRSPLQLFNCVEASKRYDDCGMKILLILARKKVDKELMEQVVAGSDAVWDEVIYGDIRSNLKQVGLILSLLRRHGRIKYCFLGDATQIVNIYINSVKPEQVVIIDDGASTYQRAKMASSGNYLVKSRHQEDIPKLKQLINRVLRLGPDFFGRASFFTMYPRIREYSKDLRIVHNDYRFFRERVASLPVSREIFFIGCDIKRYVLKNPERFEFYLAAVAKHYHGRNWSYVLHRKENESESQRQFMAEMAQKYGFQLQVFDRILEQQILHQGWQPEEVATFYSAGIDTLSRIYRSTATVFKLRVEDVKETSQFALNEMHRSYKEMNLNIVEI